MKLALASTDSLSVRSGLSLEVNNLRQDSLEIFVYTDEKFRSENKNLIYLFIQSHGIINHLSTERDRGNHKDNSS